MGEMAKPGNDVTADTNHIANNAKREIYPLPVEIFIATRFNVSYRQDASRVPKKLRVESLRAGKG
jgi:hypothetical protein